MHVIDRSIEYIVIRDLKKFFKEDQWPSRFSRDALTNEKSLCGEYRIRTGGLLHAMQAL